ncbi:MAG: hypothetical protein ACO1SX_28300 [Actinomycetota bacterium]
MIGYTIRFRLPGRVDPERVPIDVSSRRDAVEQWKGYKLASGPERRCIQLWRNETLICGEEPRWVRRAEQPALEVGE